MLGTLAAVEHAGLLWWGAFWPWRNIAAYPGDGGFNDYLILASCSLVAVSLASAAAFRLIVPPVALLAAMTVALPVAVGLLLALLNSAFLDPAVDYLTLLPSLVAVVIPYLLAAHLTR